MAAATTTTGGLALASQSSRPFAPSLWGAFFLDHQPCTPSQLLSMKRRADAAREAVRQRLLEAAATSSSYSLIRKLELVDTLQRIGVDYHYNQEIDELLRQVYDDHKDVGGSDDDLYVTSLRFYLLRKHGYSVSSDVFLKFKDEQGTISSDDDDGPCLMALYDAAHLRTHGEHILDGVITFNRSRLKSLLMQTGLKPDLAEEVRLTLETPRFRRVKRVEARRYLTVYAKMAERDEAILEFAKLDCNILQALYCEELRKLTMWWQEFQTQADTSSYARDRVVEMHFWMMEVFPEPQYSYSRKMLTQLFMIVSVIDDLYDNWCTTEDGTVFAAALQRWDEAAAEQCPEYLRNLYKVILATVKTIEHELKLQDNKHAELVKKLVIDIVKCYHAETEWRDEKYVPATVEEHLKVSGRSCGCMHVIGQGFISTGDAEAVEWAFAYPKIIRAMCVIARLANDIMSDKREQASNKNMASTVQACAREHGVTAEEAVEKLRELIEAAWMDIAEECLISQPQPAALLERVVNLARTMEFLYKDTDGYTESYSIKQTLESIYVNPVWW